MNSVKVNCENIEISNNKSPVATSNNRHANDHISAEVSYLKNQQN